MAQNKPDSVRRIAHAAIYQMSVGSDVLSDEIIENMLIDSPVLHSVLNDAERLFVVASEFELVLFP
jgi:hypothetical protein